MWTAIGLVALYFIARRARTALRAGCVSSPVAPGRRPVSDFTAPEADPDALLDYAFAYCQVAYSPEAWAFQSLDWWSAYVRDKIFPEYNIAHGPFRLTTNAWLHVRRELKYHYDQLARDKARFEADNLNWEQIRE